TVPTLTAGNVDDGYFTNIPIGFNFIYNSISYTFISASTNGFITLGQNIGNPNSQANNLTAGITPVSPRPIIAALWDDISLTATTDISYLTSGTAPNRIFTLQYLNVKWDYSGSAALSFQIKLYETTGKIEYMYTPLAGALVNASASIGITNAGTGPFNFISLTSTGNNPYDTSFTTEITTLNSKPANGQSYAFVPKYIVPIAPTSLSFSSVGSTSMNVNWTDNTISETYYQVYISTDNITFSLLSTIYSTSVTTTGAAYQYSATGLTIGTTYYFRVMPGNEGSVPANYVSGSQATPVGTLTGNKTICPSGCNYTSIAAAATDIRTYGVIGSLILELDSSYSPSVETFPFNFGNLLTNASCSVTLRPRSNVTSVINFISIPFPTFDFNATKYLTIDGRKGGTGTISYINIGNFNGSGAAIRFQNGAINNSITYCRLSGASTSINSGVVLFGSTTNTTGNSNNTISYCTIKDTISNPIYSIYSSGNVNYPNLNNTVLNNNIYDYYNGSNITYGIYLNTGNDLWTINNNHFFQTALRSLTFNNAGVVFINSGSTYTINGNYIGGSTINCGGSPMYYNGSGTLTLLNLNLTTANNCNIQNNTIQNISMDLTGAMHSFINLANGAFNVTGNLIGNTTSTSNIRFTSTGAGIIFSPISLSGGASYGNINISSNTIGGISVGGSGTTIFNGINVANAVPLLSVNNNLIGSLTTPNSIIDSTNQTLFGISLTLPSTSNTISGNTISNLSLLNTSSTISNQLRGIYINSTGSFTVTGNLVKNLTTNSTSLIPNFNSPIMGILFSASGSNQICSMNNVNGLFSTNTTLAIWMEGIYYGGTSTGTNIISRNMVHGIVSASSGASVIYGIFNAASGTNVYNNVVRLGLDTSGNDINANQLFAGIVDNNNSNSYYFNSVYIGGSGVNAGANITAAFYNNFASTGTRFLMNNIFNNSRSNNIGSGKNYAVYLTSATLTSFTINNNIYYTPGIGGALGRFNGVDYTIMNPWMVALSGDFNSGYGNPNFVAPANSSCLFSLNVQSPTPAENSGFLVPTITDDYLGNSRGFYTPTDIGAYAGNFTGVDIFVPIINYTVFTNTASTSNRVLTANLTDVGTGVRNSASMQPRIWYRRLLPSVSGWFSTGGVLVSGNTNNGTWNFTIDYSLIAGAVSVGNQYQYYIVAQDSASPINLFYNPLPGASHTNVYNQVTAPTVPNSYSIVNGLPTTITVGTGQTYTTFTGAGGLFAAINAGALSGNTVATIISDITEPGTNSLANVGMGGYNLTIKPDAYLRTLSGSLTTGGLGLISINRAVGVNIDGGPSRNLVIRNVIGATPSATTAAAVWILSGNNDTIRNCILEANNSGGGTGTLNLTTVNASSPSSGIVISNNIIRPPGNVNTNAPGVGIYIGSAAGNIFNCTIGGVTGSAGGNLISDFTNYGIYVANAGNNLTIGHPTDTANGNSFLQTMSRGTHYSILVGSGDNHIISSNKIYNATGLSHTAYVIGIYIFNSINNVTISNNSIGGTSANRSGSPYSVAASFYSIYFTGGSIGSSTVSNNSVSNILLTGASQFYGIYNGSGNVNISGNKIGGAASTSNSYDVITTSQDFYGIRHNTNSNLNLSNNIISDITNTGTGLTTGISVELGVANVTGNLIRNFAVNNTGYVGADYACNGIRISTTTSGNNIENNTITNLVNNSSTLGTSSCGIAVVGALNASTIQRNRIYNLSATSVNGGANAPIVWGIYALGTGSANYANNQISFSQNIASTQPRIRGMEVATTGGTNNFYYNSIYVGGAATGANITQDFYRNTIAPATTDIKNNIFYNERTGGGNNHYTFTSTNVTNLTNNNNLFVSLAANLPVDYPAGSGMTLATWNSLTGNPLYNLGNTTTQLSSSQLFPNLSSGDLSTTVCRVFNNGTPVLVTNDFNNSTRSTSAPEIGSTEFSVPTGFPTIVSNPSNVSICAPGNANFVMSGSAINISYQWEVNQGSGWNSLANGGVYSGVNTATLVLTGATAAMNGYQYRCTVSGTCSPPASTNAATLYATTTMTWVGNVSTDWTNSANWTCGVPTASSTAVIASGGLFMPVIADARSVNNLTINSGASLMLNNSSSNLSIYGSFVNNGTMNNTNGIVTFTGSSAQTIPSTTFNKIVINNSSGVSLSGNITLNDSLILNNGKLNLGNYNLTLGTNSYASSGNSSSYICNNGSGQLTVNNIGSTGKSGSVIFPVGVSSFNPVVFANSGTTDNFTVWVVDSITNNYSGNNHPVGPKLSFGVVNRSWIINEATIGGTNANVTLQWNSADETTGFSRSISYVAYYNVSSWYATSSTSAGGSNPYTQTRSGISSMNVFGVGNYGFLPVPVTIIGFSGMKNGKYAALTWTTASELNNNHFVIERTIDHKIYETVGMVKGNGTTNILHDYFLNDNIEKLTEQNVPSVYYRLKQVDNDGKENQYGEVSIDLLQNVTDGTVNVSPNPFNSTFKITMNLKHPALVDLKIIDVCGRTVFQKQVNMKTGLTDYSIDDLSEVKSGIYYLQVNVDGEQKMVKIAKF
ncbi:MAG: T9SS type A sorting domain-containing protein, partial [Bacteroidia bacterium]